MSKNTLESQEPAEDEIVEENDFEAENSDVQAETPEKAKFTPFSAGVYRAMVFFTLLAGGVGGYGLLKASVNPDTRTPEEMTRAYLTYRAKIAPKAVGEITDAKVKAIADNAVCLLNQMGHPLGDAYQGKKKKEHKRESNEYFIDNHNPKEPRKYVHRPNIYGYVFEDMVPRAEATIGDLRKGKDTKDFLKWFTWEPSEFLEQPLECVHSFEGPCIKTYDGSDCLLVAGLARAVTRANLAMHDDKKGQIIPMACYRNDLHQAVAFAGNSGEGCKPEGAHPGLMLPGNSYHGMGLAMDLSNQSEAEDYLAEVGVSCGFIKGDEGHCSFAEQSMNGNLRSKLKQKLQKWKSWGKKVKGGWKVWRNNK